MIIAATENELADVSLIMMDSDGEITGWIQGGRAS